MKYSFPLQAKNSFYLFADHELLQEGEGFTNTTGSLYPVNEKKINNYSSAQSPYAQWVYDSSISGAIVNSGVYLNDSFVERGQSGLNIGYAYGRVFYEGKASSVSGSYSYKDFNLYLKTDDEVFALLDSDRKGKTVFHSPTGANVNDIVVPAAIIYNSSNPSNRPFALGGEEESITNFEILFIGDDYQQIEAAMGVMNDTRGKYLPFVSDPKHLPFNAFGDLKSGTYNYNDLKEIYPYNQMFIDRVRSSKIVKTENSNYSFGISYFTIEHHRFPRL